MSNKTYGGIIDHKEKAAINELVIELKFSGIGFRAIGTELKNRYGINTTHTTISSYYKEVLNGESLDKIKASVDDKIEREGANVKPSLDVEILETLNKEFGDSEIGKIYAKIVALCSSNLQSHIEGGERIKLEYTKYLKDIDAIRKRT